MRKEVVIPVVVIIMVAALGMYWYYGDRDDVRIVGLDAPRRLGLETLSRLNITLLNNETVPVNVNIDVKNAFIGKNGTTTSRTAFFINSDLKNGLHHSPQVSLEEEVTLMPGNNTFEVYLGYVVTGNHGVDVRVYQNKRLIDESTVIVEVPVPKLSLELEYEKLTTDDFNFYRIDGYLTNHELGSVDVTTKVTVTNDKTGEVVSTDVDDCTVGGHEKKSMSGWNISRLNISNWEDSPVTLIELAHNESSNVSYMPITSVVKGKIGDRYRVNVTSTSRYQVVSAEIVVPPD
jgi:hypothetical protein